MTHPRIDLFATRSARQPSIVWWLLLACIFAAGLAVRLYRLGDPPVDFHPTRQLHSALIARGMFLQGQAGIPEWQRQMAVAQWQMEGFIEPQILERVAAWGYQLTGAIDLRIPRLISILAWMVGAAFLVLLARQMFGWAGALAGSLFYLAWPYGMIASRSFQPEPLLLALILAALWAALHWEDHPTWGWALLAGLLAGLAVLVKAVGVFFVGPVLVVLVFVRHLPRWRGLFRDPQIWLMALLAVLPYAAYHIYGVYVRGDLTGQFSQRFFPAMWIDPAFYLRWISNLGRVLPFGMVLAAACGALLPARPAHRAVLLALWIGYIAYGLALPHHISTHDYYHLLLFPAAGLGIGALAQVVFDHWRGPGWLLRILGAAVLLEALLLYAYDARTLIKRSGAVEQAQVWLEIGSLLGPDAPVAAVVDDYGSGLKYYAWINPLLWPTSADLAFQGGQASVEEWFSNQAAGRAFLVISELEELDRQPALAAYLQEHATLMKQTPAYRVYDLRP